MKLYRKKNGFAIAAECCNCGREFELKTDIWNETYANMLYSATLQHEHEYGCPPCMLALMISSAVHSEDLPGGVQTIKA